MAFAINTGKISSGPLANTDIGNKSFPALRVSGGSTTPNVTLRPVAQTFTANPGNALSLTGTFNLNFALASWGLLAHTPTVIHHQAGFAFAHFLLFNNQATFRNLTATAVNFGAGFSFVDQPTVQADGAAIVMGIYRGFVAQPSFSVLAAGTLTVAELTNLFVQGGVSAGVTVTTKRGLWINNPSPATGAITTHIGIDIANLTLGTTTYAIQSAHNGTGFIHHTGTAPSMFGGPIQLGAGAVFDVVLSRGVANRLDLASGDTLRLVTGPLEFAGAAEQISRTAGELLLTGTNIRTSAALEIDGALNHDGATVGLYGTAPAVQQTIVGSRGGNVALADLLTKLALTGLIVDGTVV